MADLKDTVTPYKFECKNFIPILPLVYSEALSYMEALAQYCEKLNEVIDALNSFSSEVLAEANAYTDSRVNAQTDYINRTVNELNQLIEQIDREYARFTQAITEDFNKLKEETEASIVASNYRTDLKIAENNEYIISHMTEQLRNVKVINFFNGEEVSIQDMFDYLAMFHLQNALNYNQLYAKNNTYAQLRDYNMTYTQLVNNGNVIIQAS